MVPDRRGLVGGTLFGLGTTSDSGAAVGDVSFAQRCRAGILEFSMGLSVAGNDSLFDPVCPARISSRLEDVTCTAADRPLAVVGTGFQVDVPVRHHKTAVGRLGVERRNSTSIPLLHSADPQLGQLVLCATSTVRSPGIADSDVCN